MGGKIGFIGGGNMAEALIKGIIKSEIYTKSDILVADIQENRLEHLRNHYGVKTTIRNQEVINLADIIILAVKPQILSSVLKDITLVTSSNNLFISIVAGVSIFSLKAQLGQKTRLVRVMPNTPALVLEGMTAICSNEVNEDDLKVAEQIFSAVGRVIVLDEQFIDAVTGLSGSGPAYIAMIIEALSDGGVLAGLPRKIAQELALQTILGTVRLVMETHQHPASLKDMVASPGGTTIYGISALEKGGLRASLIEAVRSATLRSQELSRASHEKKSLG